MRPLVDAHFGETELPSAIRCGVRLRPDVWAWLVRCVWWCGWSSGVEGVEAARGRAARAAGILAAQAGTRGPIVLVGHGFMNVLIAAQLRRAGWSGPRFPPRCYWGFSVYERVAPNNTYDLRS